MSHFQQHPAFFNKPVILTEEEKRDPISVINDFFTDYNLSEVREIHHNIDHVCLTSDVPPFDDPEERDNLLSFRESEQKVIEAALILLETHSDDSLLVQVPKSNPIDNIQPTGTMDIDDVQNTVLHLQNKLTDLRNVLKKACSEGFVLRFPQK